MIRDANAGGASGGEPVAGPSARRLSRWKQRYALRLGFSDVAIVALTLFAYWCLLASVPEDVVLDWPTGPRVPYTVALTVIGVLWVVALNAVDSRDRRMVGSGAVEYQRVVVASFTAFAVSLAIAFFLRIDLARSLFFIALPIGVVLLVLSRWLWRQWLRAQQRRGMYVHRAIVVGERRKVQHVVRTVRRAAAPDIVILGAMTDAEPGDALDVPVLGSFADTVAAVDAQNADTVILAGADDLPPETVRRISWAMADRDVSWIVVPAFTDVAGPRVHSRQVAGLPLLHVSFPRLEGSRRFVKRSFDIVASLVLIALASPVLLAVAIAVRRDSDGAILYAQERVGYNGTRFRMLKFRSMVAGADDQLASLLDLQGTSDQPLFKVNDDPRITRVGRFLRRHSLDELPQLFNVLRGDMSLVGPRPQHEREVALYDGDAHRRLLVKPGMSGLWQVSGRSALTWEDALRLDLYYIENWSLTQDVVILFRTIKAVVAPGATAH